MPRSNEDDVWVEIAYTWSYVQTEFALSIERMKDKLATCASEDVQRLQGKIEAFREMMNLPERKIKKEGK